MTIRDVVELLKAEVICGEEFLDNEIKSACGCDMMSDVLAFVKTQPMLLTGLVNPQVIRTALMMDMKCVAFVRNKKPDEKVIGLAKEHEIVLLSSPYRMYDACGVLYTSGLRGEGACE
ncbi:MAG: DRTGG domain-containing protein [Clostridia bacterium]|nr:DRTGG domain-containing protein [Clostridia bacterium]